MDSTIVGALARVLDDVGNQRIDSDTAKSEIATILSGKSLADVLQKLDTYVLTRSDNRGIRKEQAVLIVIMALLRLDLNFDSALVQEIQTCNYKLAGPLYGGLAMLLKGKSRHFSFQLSVLNRETKNAYKEIEQWNDRFFWPHINLFLTAKLLHSLDPKRFERLVQEDPNCILLLSMAQGHLPISPSDDLLQKLLESRDPLHPQFALAFYVLPILMLYSKNQCKKPKPDDIKKLSKDVDRCLAALKPCSLSLRTELLTNYLLVHPKTVPSAFARQLVGSELQAEFARKITEPGKIQTIRELSFIASTIAETPACNEQKHRITKKPLKAAVLNVLIRFIRERTGIYVDNQHPYWLKDTEKVLRLLTKKQKRCFKNFLDSQDRTLMINPLDRLVRFSIYSKDVRQHEIIQSLQECLAHIP